MATANRSWSQSRTNSRISRRSHSKLTWTLLATAPVAAALWTHPVLSQTLTWDSSGTSPTAPADGSGNWDTTSSANWSNGSADSPWTNGDVAVFGTNNGAAGTVTIDDASGSVSAAGINFNTPSSGSYTIAASGSDSLNLSGTVNVNGTVSPTISAPIAGSGFTLSGTGATNGTLTLAGVNTFSGNLVLTGNTTLDLNSGATLGNSALALTMGAIGAQPGGVVTPPTTISTLNLNASATVSSFTVDNNSSTNNTLTIASGATFAVSGAVSISLNPKLGSGTTNTNLVISGAATFNATNSTNSSFLVGTGETDSANPTGSTQALLDMSNLSNFVFSTGTGEFDVGNGAHGKGVVKLANVSNVITSSTLRVGDSHDGTVSGNAGGTSTLSLGTGTNRFNVNAINVGEVKDNGVMNFLSTTGSLVVNGESGASATTALNIGVGGSGSSNAVGAVNLAGHNVSMNLNTITIGDRSSGNAAIGASGSFSFDNGTVDATVLAFALNTTTTAGPASATMTIGNTTTSTAAGSAVLNVNVSNAANTSGLGSVAVSGSTSMSLINLEYGALANINSALITTATNGATATATIDIAGGTLNMMGNAIGGNTNGGTFTINATTGELENMGKINGAGGITMNTAGSTVIIAGTNAWTGGTTISAGTLQIGSATQAGSLPAGGNVMVNDGLVFAQAGTTNDTSIFSGSGTITQSGSGRTILNGASGGFAGTVNLSSGALELVPTATLGASTFNMTGGTAQFDLGGANAGLLDVSGTATLSSGSLALGLDGSLSDSTYTVLTAGTLNNSLTFSPEQVGRATLTPSVSGNSIIVTVSGGGPANLTWIGSNAGAAWDVQTTKNWWNPNVDATEQADDLFFNLDSVTFDDTASSFTVNIASGGVSPGSMTVNSSHNYLFQGTGGIGGAGGISKEGTGTLVFAEVNTYAGGTTIGNGAIQLAAAGALPSGTALTLGDGSGNSGVLDLNGNSATVGGLNVAGGAGSANTVTNSSATLATLTFAGGTSVYSGAISSAIALTVSGGSLALSGTTNYTDNTAVNTNATLALSGSATLPTGTSLTDNGAVSLTNSASISTLNGSATVATLNLNSSTLTVTNGGTFAGVISGAGSVDVNGGTLNLTANNSFTGGATVNSGTLEVHGSGGNTALGSGTATVNAGATLIGANSDSFGFAPDVAPGTNNQIVINGGTVSDLGTSNYRVTAPDITFNGGTLTSAANNTGDVSGNYSLLGNKTTALVTVNAAATTATISAKAISFQEPAVFNVTHGTSPSGIDLLVTSQLLPFNTTGTMPFQLSGNGVTDFDANSPTLTSTITLSGGTLQIGLLSDTAAIPAPLGTVATPVINNTTLAVASSQSVTLVNNISGSGVVTQNGTGVLTLSGNNSYGGGTNVNSGQVVIGAAGALPSGGNVTNNAALAVNANSTAGDVSGTGTTTVAGSVSFAASNFTQGALVNNGSTQINDNGTVGGVTGTGTLTIGTGSSTSTLQLATNSGASTQTGLVVNTGATLDITNNHMFIVYGANVDPLASIKALVVSGYNAGSWNGTGIISSTAATNNATHGNLLYGVGYADSADTGNPAGLPSGTIEIKYTLLGDADLSGVVDGTDFGIVAANFNKGVSGWDQGDFNYDNVVDGTDFGDLAANFNKGASGADVGEPAIDDPAIVAFAEANGLMSELTAGVPEPASIGLIAVGACGLMARRRRK